MRAALALAVAVGLLTCACSRHARAQRRPEPIRFATDWRAEAEQGGFYEALADGEYARRGLDVPSSPAARA